MTFEEALAILEEAHPEAVMERSKKKQAQLVWPESFARIPLLIQDRDDRLVLSLETKFAEKLKRAERELLALRCLTANANADLSGVTRLRPHKQVRSAALPLQASEAEELVAVAASLLAKGGS